MEPKKNPSADLERWHSLTFGIAITISLLLVIGLFQISLPRSQQRAASMDASPEILLPIPITEAPNVSHAVIMKQIREVKNDQQVAEEIHIDTEIGIQSEPVVEIPAIDIPIESDNTIYLTAEIPAEPEGGMNAFYAFVKRTLRYPSQARRMDVEGRVFVEFVINQDGSITDVKILKGIGAGCDEEAVRVVESSPAWNPGKQRGKPVRQRMVLPINFKLG